MESLFRKMKMFRARMLGTVTAVLTVQITLTMSALKMGGNGKI